jgi:hypothetical protein
MYIALPAFERVFHRGELAAMQKYEHGINVAAALTNTENVRVRYFEGAHVLGMVIKCLREQRNGSSTRLRFGILNLPRINIPVPITKSWA